MKTRLRNALEHYWRTLVRRGEAEEELAAEIEQHIEELTEEYQRKGLSRAEAYKAARIRFGGVERVREECRESWSIRFVSNFWRDSRLAARSLLRTPSITLVAIATLALGIGVNTSMFSMLNGYLLRPLAYPDSQSLFRLYQTSEQQQYGSVSIANYQDLDEASDSVADIAGFLYWGFTLADGDQPAEMPQSMRVTANFLDVLGLKPRLGRGFQPDEDVVGRNRVIIISHRYWRDRFDSDPRILGRLVKIDGQAMEIVGVLPPDPDMTRVFSAIDLFRPIGATLEESTPRFVRNMGVVGRYKPGVSAVQAQALFDAVADRLATAHPKENKGMRLEILSLQSTSLLGLGRTVTFLLVGLSGFVLLIACSNLANILLARTIGRLHEFTIRSALGASRFQLVRPLAIESLLLSLVGGCIALLLSFGTSKWLSARFSDAAQPIDFSPDMRVMAFAALASVGTALLFGAGSIVWASRLQVGDSLKSGSRTVTRGRGETRFGHLLIVWQFALALVLLAGSGFFIRGLDRLTNMDTGWDPSGVVSGVVNLASPQYSTAEPIVAFHEQLRQRLEALPGVESACSCYSTPLSTSPSQRQWTAQGRELPPPGQEIFAHTNGVSDGYFATMGTRLREGRYIDQRDRLTSQRVVVINESMALSLFPGESAVGKTIGQVGAEEQTWAEVVGVVEDTRPMAVRPSPILFEVYKPFDQEAWQYATFALRAATPQIAATLDRRIRETVASLDAELPVFSLMPMPQQIRLRAGFWNTINQLLLVFALLGVFLSALGIYGVVARHVAQRKGEIGIRLALGAKGSEIKLMVLKAVTRFAVAGSLAGIVGAYFLRRYIASEAPTIGAGSPLPILVAAVALIAVAVVACHFPARRAMLVSPRSALSAE